MSSNPQQSLQATESHERWIVPGVCILIAALVWVVFGQARGFEFVNYDDADNVSGSPLIAAGLGWHGIAWAFTHGQVGRWAPLVAVSHMADCQFFGLQPGGHHLTNVALHSAVAVLLFLAIRELTGALWRSAFVAAVFAIHPLRAEVVGWVSARGDVMAGLFFMLTLLAYARYAHAGAAARGWHWCVAAFFAMGLMCKPTIVMLPFVLLLLDYWPLGRLRNRTQLPGLLVEKIPLFLLSLLSFVAAVLAQQSAIVPGEKLSLSIRASNAVVSCAIYAWQMIWPADLAAFYPYPQAGIPAWQVAASLLFLVIVSAVVYAGRRRFCYAAAGWCWYLVMLLPVLGIIETGAQAHADRYTYLPQIGLYLLLAWGIAGLTAKWDNRREIMGAAAAGAITLLAWRAHDQVSVWEDSVSLWRNTVESTGPNSIAENNLGNALLQKGRIDDAMTHLQKALEIDPGLADAHLSLGNALVRSERLDEAIAQYRQALDLRPGYAKTHINLGVALQKAGRVDEAAVQYQQALEIEPNLASAHNNMGMVFLQERRPDEAISEFKKAVKLQPGDQSFRDNLSLAQQQKEQAERQ